jgi:hypothetical protein
MNPTTGYAAGRGFRTTEPNNLMLFDGLPVIKGRKIALEGNTENDNETVLSIVEPTQQNLIEFPNTSGTFILDVSTAYATSSIFSASVSLSIYNSAGVLQKTIVGSTT